MIEVNVLTCKTQGLGLFFELTGRDYHPGSQNSASAYFASASGLIYLAIIKIFRDCNSNRLTILQRFSTLFNAFQRFSMLFCSQFLSEWVCLVQLGRQSLLDVATKSSADELAQLLHEDPRSNKHSCADCNSTQSTLSTTSLVDSRPPQKS